jgi:hypothetical protein
MTKTIIAVAAIATLFAGAASAHGRQPAHLAQPAVAVGVGAKVGSVATAGLGATVASHNSLLNVQTVAKTPLAVGLGAQVGGRNGELLSLDLGAFSGGVGR